MTCVGYRSYAFCWSGSASASGSSASASTCCGTRGRHAYWIRARGWPCCALSRRRRPSALPPRGLRRLWRLSTRTATPSSHSRRVASRLASASPTLTSCQHCSCRGASGHLLSCGHERLAFAKCCADALGLSSACVVLVSNLGHMQAIGASATASGHAKRGREEEQTAGRIQPERSKRARRHQDKEPPPPQVCPIDQQPNAAYNLLARRQADAAASFCHALGRGSYRAHHDQ